MRTSIVALGFIITLGLGCQQVSAQNWDELLASADSLARVRNFDSAITMATMALEQAEAELGLEDTTVAGILHTLTSYNFYRGNYEEAEKLGLRALALRDKLLDPEHPDMASICRGLGAIYHKLARFDEAEPLYLRALAIQEKVLGLEHPDVAKSVNNLAVLYLHTGQFAKAEPMYVRALAIWEKIQGSDGPNVGRSLNNLAVFYVDMGRYAKAEPLYLRALSIYEETIGEEHPWMAETLANLAVVHRKNGRFDKAVTLQVRGLAVSKAVHGPQHPETARHLTQLATVYKEMGQYGEVGQMFNEALAILENSLGPEHPRVGYTLTNQANFHRSQGRSREAEPLYHRAVDIFEQSFGPDHPDVAGGLTNLANCYRDLDRLDEAKPLYERSLAICEETLGPKHNRVAECLTNLADYYRGASDDATEEEYTSRALALIEDNLGPEHPTIVFPMTNLSALRIRQGNLAEAEQLLFDGLAIREKALGDNHPLVAETLGRLSYILRLENKPVKAIEFARRSFDVYLRNLSDNARSMSEKDALTYSQISRRAMDRYLTCCYELDSSFETGVEEAVEVIMSAKGLVSDQVYERQQVLVNETDSTATRLIESLRSIKFRLSRLFVEGPGEDLTSHRRIVDSMENLINRLETDLSYHSSSFRKYEDPAGGSIGQLATLIPDKTVLVEYVKYNYLNLKPDTTVPRYLAVVITHKAKPIMINLGDAVEIDPLVDDYLDHMRYVSTVGTAVTASDLEEYKLISHKLFTLIWEPLGNHVTGGDLVLVAPDGILNVVSMAGLVDNEGRYLVEKSPLHYLSSGRDLIRFGEKPEIGRGLLAMGDPDFNVLASQQAPDVSPPDFAALESSYFVIRNIRSQCSHLQDVELSPLPGSRNEVRAIVSSWEDSNEEPSAVYFGADATEDRFKAKAPGCRVIHLATHGYFLGGICRQDSRLFEEHPEESRVGENPLLLSGLFLAGANLHGQGADSLGVEDGILTAYEVSALNLRGIELVVLSACETGLGEVQTGEGVYGLRRAFEMAGARTVISSLWPVSDQTATTILSHIYGRGDVSLPDAMQTAQLSAIKALRRQGKVDHPVNWAAFIVAGAWN